MVIATAGRRVDAADTKTPRFPSTNVTIVRERVRAMLQKEGASTVVCSAACGADLIALEEAGSLKLRRIVVLPFERERFKETSVIDRPGDWGHRFDEVIDEVKKANDLIILNGLQEEEAYQTANSRILDEAGKLAQHCYETAKAALIWNGESRGADDITEAFGTEARARGFTVLEVSTLTA